MRQPHPMRLYMVLEGSAADRLDDLRPAAKAQGKKGEHSAENPQPLAAKSCNGRALDSVSRSKL